MQTAVRVVRFATDVRGAVTTVRWFSHAALRIWRYLRPTPKCTNTACLSRGYVVVGSIPERSTVPGRRSLTVPGAAERRVATQTPDPSRGM